MELPERLAKDGQDERFDTLNSIYRSEDFCRTISFLTRLSMGDHPQEKGQFWAAGSCTVAQPVEPVNVESAL